MGPMRYEIKMTDGHSLVTDFEPGGPITNPRGEVVRGGEETILCRLPTDRDDAKPFRTVVNMMQYVLVIDRRTP